jgi:phage-related minor tail protein
MANKGIKGITIEIGGETTGLQKALQDVNKKSRDLQSELKQVDRLLKFDPGNAELIAQKQQLLGEQVQNTTEKLNRLKEAQSQVERQFKNGEIGAEQYRAFQREIASTEGKLKGLREQISKIDDGSINDVKNDMSKLSKGTDEAKGAVKELGGELTGLVAGLAAGGGIAGAIEKALDTSSLDTTIEISMEVPEDSKKSVKDAINTVSSYGVDAEEALESVRRQWALNKDASDESNAAIVEGAGAIARAYAGIDFTELIQEANEISRELNISNEEALGLTNSLLKVGFPPEQLDVIAEYGKQLTDAGYNAEEIQAIMSAGVETGTWNIDNLLDGLKEGRIKLAEFGQEVPKATKDLLANTEISTKQFQEWGKAVSEGGTTGREAMQEAAQALLEVEESTTRNALGVQMFGTMWEDQGTNITDTILNMDSHMMSAKENQDALNQSVEGLNADPAVKMQQAMADLKVALQPVFEVISNVIAKIAEWASQNPTLTATIVAITSVIGILIGIAMALVPIFVAISTAAAAAGISMAAIAAPIAIAVAAIAAIIAIGIALYKNWDVIKAKAVEIWGSIKSFMSNTAESIKNGVSKSFESLKTKTASIFQSTKDSASKIWQNIQTAVSNSVSNLVSRVRTKFQEMANGIRDKMNSAKSTATDTFNNMKSSISGRVSEITSNVSSKFDQIKNNIQNPIRSATDFVRGQINKIKGFFSGLKLELPKIKLPHFSLSGSFSLKPPRVPKLSVNWYKTGGMFDGPSVIGVGEQPGVKEAVIPMSGRYMKPFAEEIAKQMGGASAGVVNIQPAPLYLDNQLIGEIMFNRIDNQFNNQAQMSLYMKGARG